MQGCPAITGRSVVTAAAGDCVAGVDLIGVEVVGDVDLFRQVILGLLPPIFRYDKM